MIKFIHKEDPTDHSLVRGKLWWKEEWYSICSMHGGNHQEDCNMCNTGNWVNVWMHNIGSIIYKLFPNLWRWWVNR